MGWRKENRRRKQIERPFARRFKYESAKEALGKLVEWGTAGVGMLAGLGAAKYGLPVSPGVASTGGAIIGGMLGSQGKALVVAGFDHLRERRDQRRTATTSAGSRAASPQRTGSSAGGGATAGTRTGTGAGSAYTPIRSGTSTSIAGQVIGGLDTVMSQLNRASRQLAEIHRAMWDAQNALNAVLAGGRPDVVLTLEGQLSTARGHVHDATGQLAGAADNLATYRAAI
ncbi:hypothetical protein ACN28G_18185 [Micromonospora sp. WMMA1923]|uniref:hypothetical protein n=1 Tax=Micromonospora sp. WMMA1923 TaxID=3404125 RepID=UPI003B95D8E2